ncbi:MAG: hypothetical protein IPG23_24800 [Burkholderiales bacterium]|nr:hypothetical protein [Burkholderiales bacterium]
MAVVDFQAACPYLPHDAQIGLADGEVAGVGDGDVLLVFEIGSGAQDGGLAGAQVGSAARCRPSSLAPLTFLKVSSIGTLVL